MKRQRWLLAALVALSMAAPAFADDVAGEHVHFAIATAPPSPFRLAKLGPEARTYEGPVLAGHFLLPARPGPAPAVVLMLPCYDPAVFKPWLKRLRDWGYATLRFSRCRQDHPVFQGTIAAYDWKEGADAAYGALTYLRSRPEIDPDRIAILSWSRFGAVPLSVLNEGGVAQFHRARFKAAVALYPFCSFARGPHLGPILVIAAGTDDWVSADVCRRLGRETRNDRFPIEVMTIDGVAHGFDIEAFGPPRHQQRAINPDGFNAPGGTMGFDRQARDAAVERVRTFLAQHLSSRDANTGNGAP